MQKQTSLYIPKPCHEDWNKMTPTQQGKFCGSCSKQVIDFSLMSDQQILKFLSNQSGKLCGRFDAEQLQRPLIETKIKKKKSWWMALTMPLLFLFDRSEAQENIKLTGDTIYNVLPYKEAMTEQLTGKVSICEQIKLKTIEGSVVDENDKPFPFVSVYQKGTKHGTTTDSLGNFNLKVNFSNDSTMLVASYVGFETVEKEIKLNEPEIVITMQFKPIILSDVVVTSYGHTTGKITLGGAIAVCRRTTTFEKIDTSIRKILNISAFKIFPNPAIKGSNIHIEIKQPGEYQLLLFDNQSHPIQTEEINADSERSTTPIQLPSNITAGIYYLRLIDEQKKKSYTGKLIIQ